MKTAAMSKLEALLETRRLNHTLLRPWLAAAPARTVSSGVAPLDAVLAGGWRLGEVSEVVGAASSGRTCLAVAALAASTAGGRLAALVDTTDRFDPGVAADAGADLTRLLWVRGPAMSPGAARPAMVDRAVRQAVRACDLIVRAGGFSVVVLDLADVPSRRLRLLPHPTWMRLARAIEGQPTACLVIAPTALGRSARGVTVQVSAAPRWQGTSAQSRRLAALEITARFQTAHAVVQSVDLESGGLQNQAALRTPAPSDHRTIGPNRIIGP
ncbi:MAG TPA: hypothetical protein VMM93_14710 [Vicinamibacterales bacterium]|nr:hypothetical protein [Vicinamibacterales bacterium]